MTLKTFCPSLPQPPDNEFDEFGNRVGGFEGPDQYVIDARPIKPTDKNQIDGSGRGGSGNYYNRRPSKY